MRGSPLSGRLVVCPTPIGNLGDISVRVRQALSEADVCACEDTRRAGRLFELLGLRPRIPAGMLAGVITAFVDGLAVATAVDAGGNPRLAFGRFLQRANSHRPASLYRHLRNRGMDSIAQ